MYDKDVIEKLSLLFIPYIVPFNSSRIVRFSYIPLGIAFSKTQFNAKETIKI